VTPLRHARAACVRLLALARRDRHERDLAAEIESHLQLHIDDNLRAGMTPAEARRQAVLALGGIEQAKEHYRARRGAPGVEAIVQDVRFGARMLRKHPAFTAAAVLTLAIGFGPPIAISTLAHEMVLRAVPGVRDPGAVSLYMTGTAIRGGVRIGRVSYLNLRDVTPRLRTIRLAAMQRFIAASVGGNRRPERLLNGQFVSGDYFDVLGVRIQTGRPLGASDDDPSNPTLVAVISDGLWASLFDRHPGAVGQTIAINGHPVTVVGIADRDFQGALRFEQDAFWMPGVTEAALRALEGRRPDDRAAGGYYQFVARLAPDATWSQADAELASLTGWLREQYPTENEKFSAVGFHNQGPIGEYRREQLARLLVLMFGAALLVLFIASANVASLALMRGLARREELAIRRTLGASRSRVIRQQVTETTLLWLLGGTAGLLLVWILVKGDISARLTDFGIPALPVHVGWPIVAFALGLALMVGLVFSLVPAWKGATVEPAPSLQVASRTATRRLRAAPVLTIAQLAASLALLIGALTLAATLRNLMSVELGFEPANVTVFRARAPVGASESAAYGYMNEWLRRLAARPGVAGVAIAYAAPFAGAGTAVMRVRRDSAADYLEMRMEEVLSPQYFSTLGIPLVRGSAFTADDIPVPGGSTRSAVILGESLARQLFGTLDVVGRTVQQPVYQQPPRSSVIVGVAADVRLSSLTEEPPPTLYSAGGLFGFRNGATLIVRTQHTESIADDIRAIAASLGSAPPTDIRTLDEAVARARGEWDVLAWLMSGLALVALVVASVGVYGVVAFAAASRRAEYGIRMALGATAPTVRRHVLRGASWMTMAGLVFGLGGAFALMQVLQNRLFGVSPLEPVIWGSATILLVALVAVASLIPARQAARVSLADTLKAM
jgi:predicted permease